jgi:hypothetical protein
MQQIAVQWSAMQSNEPFSSVPNTSEAFRNVPQSSEGFGDLHNTLKRAGGVGRGKKYDGAEIPDHDIGRDFLIMEEAYTLFDSQGERRSLRMIGEYCKTGELICSYDSDDKRWHITRESVENKITKIKALNARKVAASPPSTSESFSERPTAPQRPAERFMPNNEEAPSSSDTVRKLEAEILDLKITNKAKDYVIEQMQKERVDFIDRIENSGRLVGRLKAQLLQLMPGRRPQGNEADSPAPDTSTSPPVANEPTDATVREDDDDDYANPPEGSYAAA